MPARLHLRVTAAAQNRLRQGHPWLFNESILEQSRPATTGELAIIYDRNDRFLALGLFDAESPLRVRVLVRDKPARIDRAWWTEQLRASVERRTILANSETTGYRVVHGESDGWPGLVVDRYAGTYVVKLYTSAWLSWWGDLLPVFQEVLQPERIVLRLSRNIQAVAAERYKMADGETVLGNASEVPVVFQECGVRFQADVVRGQKTGFFLDQRENRQEVGQLAAGRTVLNAFSFSGGFSLAAARGGAISATDLDISEHALASARANWQLNQEIPAVQSCRHETIAANAFEWLERAQARSFGVVVLDPPSLAKREVERERAVGAYQSLAAHGLRLLERNGVLVAASCSAHVSAPEFFQAVTRAATMSGRPFTILQTREHPVDHPANFTEARYLKCLYLRLND